MEEYLQVSEVIDWQEPAVLERAQHIASGHPMPDLIAKACFEWVRDEIHHSVDYQMNPVTYRASEVLQYRTGCCYAKSHCSKVRGIPQRTLYTSIESLLTAI